MGFGSIGGNSQIHADTAGQLPKHCFHIEANQCACLLERQQCRRAAEPLERALAEIGRGINVAAIGDRLLDERGGETALGADVTTREGPIGENLG
jgi:hypothetical protein